MVMNKKNNRLSHSSVTRFQNCPKSYEYHYIERLRPKISSAALLFGSAVDTMIQVLLQNTKLPVSEQKDPEQIFKYHWTNAEINEQSVYLPTYTNIAYSKSDFDRDLISDEHKEIIILAYGPEWENKLNAILDKQKQKIPFKFFKKEEKELLNICNWACLHRKGLLMLDAVKKKVIPRIKEVMSVQQYVKLENSNEDSVIGYADLVCRFTDNPTPVIIDFKTSSIDYDEDAVLTNPQLTLYVHALSDQFENTRKAGFIVLHKHIIKNKKKICVKCDYDGTGTRFKTCNNEVNAHRCDGNWIETIDPEVKIQFIMDEIPTKTEEIIIQNIDDINIAIKNDTFVRNLGSCVKPYGKCEFYSKCYQGKDDDLIKLDDNKRNK